MQTLFDIKLIKSRSELQAIRRRSTGATTSEDEIKIDDQTFSINQLLKLEKSEVGIQIYEVIQEAETKYIQLKITDFIGFNNQKRTMIQMIDITGNILHNQQKTQNEFLQLINACVSHDLRNPLNSIKAMNIEKKYFYKLMDEALNNEEISLLDLIKNLKTTLKQLKKNLKTQDYSCDLMHFTI